MNKSTLQDSVAKEDVSVAISKLTFGIDDVSKQIKSLVESQCPRRLRKLTRRAHARYRRTMNTSLVKLPVQVVYLAPLCLLDWG